jgi:hypothetical protein
MEKRQPVGCLYIYKWKGLHGKETACRLPLRIKIGQVYDISGSALTGFHTLSGLVDPIF